MHISILSAFAALSLAVPLLKERDPKLYTVTRWEVVTVTSYTTIYGSPASSTFISSSAATAASSTTVYGSSAISAPSSSYAITSASSTTSYGPPTSSTSVSSSATTTVRSISSIQQDHTTSLVIQPSTTPPAVVPSPPETTVPIPDPKATTKSTPSTSSTSSTAPAQTSEPAAGGAYPVTKLQGAITSDGPCTPGQSCSGDITHFNPSMGLGACGYKDWTSKTIWQDEDYVVAVSSNIMGSYSNGGTPDSLNELCKRSVHIKAQAGGVDIVARVVDKCPTCPGNFDLDLSPAVFNKVAPKGDGRVSNVQWYWV